MPDTHNIALITMFSKMEISPDGYDLFRDLYSSLKMQAEVLAASLSEVILKMVHLDRQAVHPADPLQTVQERI